jgi:hypothetical protein
VQAKLAADPQAASRVSIKLAKNAAPSGNAASR